ncbi:MAG: hypothetical protein IJB31_06620 [Akkermansia sp.]|nr:hypothetical protein [Akkermansia sp.]
MKIDRNTSQTELESLYKAVVRREFLRNTPLNIKTFLRYALLFALFPGMRLGFRVGLLITAAFSVLLMILLLCGEEQWATWAVFAWVLIGAVVLFCVCIQVVRVAAETKRARMEMLPPESGLLRCRTCPELMPLPWTRDKSMKQRHTASVAIEVPCDGIYAFILHMDKGQKDCRIVTHGRRGTCVVYAQGGGKSGEPFQALVLYRLAAGCHELRWSVDSPKGIRPHATLTQMNIIA